MFQTASPSNARERADGHRVAVLPGHDDSCIFAGTSPDFMRCALTDHLPTSFLQRRTNFSVLLGHGPRLGAAPDSRTLEQPENFFACTTFGSEGEKRPENMDTNAHQITCRPAGISTKPLQTGSAGGGTRTPDTRIMIPRVRTDYRP